MRKKTIISATCLLIAALFMTVAVASSDTYVMISSEDAEEWVREQDAAKAALYADENEDMYEFKDLLEIAYEKADESQRKKLDNIQKESFLGGIGEYRKQILIIMNELPEDTPMITLEEAKEICNSLDREKYKNFSEYEASVISSFDEIAGAPDFYGGSGITMAVYFLNESHDEYIKVWLARVVHVKLVDGNEEWTFIDSEFAI